MNVELKVKRTEAVILSEKLYEHGYEIMSVYIPCGNVPALIIVANCAIEDLKTETKNILSTLYEGR